MDNSRKHINTIATASNMTQAAGVSKMSLIAVRL